MCAHFGFRAKEFDVPCFVNSMHNCKRIHELDIFDEVTDVLNVGTVFVFALELKPGLIKHPLEFILACRRLRRWGWRVEGACYYGRAAAVLLRCFLSFFFRGFRFLCFLFGGGLFYTVISSRVSHPSAVNVYCCGGGGSIHIPCRGGLGGSIGSLRPPIMADVAG